MTRGTAKGRLYIAKVFFTWIDLKGADEKEQHSKPLLIIL